MTQTEAKSMKDLAKPCNKVLEKLGWKWKGQVGEFVTYKNLGIGLIIQTFRFGKLPQVFWPKILDFGDTTGAIPILHWEEIERLLEGKGYELSNISTLRLEKDKTYGVWIRKNGQHLIYGEGKSRQEAVMRAVIKLGERQI